ncbi:MAG: nitrate reductase molybdenum cofactor assembly chaperone [Alphaproteobacteria bacterium]|nr:nitrate reductase molybdenum cofactor assembly chaperone [Alphaproteobacteria bacterium]
MIRTFKALSALLSYPSEEIKAAASEFSEAIAAEALVSDEQRRALDALLDGMAHRDLYDLQEQYVALFDRTRALSLHLFEHVHGESRDRGQAMVDLLRLYEDAGLVIEASELPDYLPLFLEFLSTQPLTEARDLLNQPLHIIAALGQRLRQRESAYAAVMDTLVAVASGAAEAAAVTAILEVPDDDPNDLAELDRVWEEAAVVFGPGGEGGDDCPKASDILQRMGAKDLAPRSQ